MREVFVDHRFGETLIWTVLVQKLSKAFIKASGFTMLIQYLRDTHKPLVDD